MRIGFIWDGISTNQHRWHDGMWKALQILKTRHEIGYFEPLATEAIHAFKPDVILWWGALCEPVRPMVDALPYKKACAFAGGPINPAVIGNFDLYFTESKINEDEFAGFGKNYMRAFGINEELFYPIECEKRYDAAIWACFALWKRHNLFADAVGEKGLAVGRFQDHEKQCYEWCQEKGMDVREELSRYELAPLLNQASVAINPASFWGGGQRMTLEAMAMNIPVVVCADSPKNCEYVEESGFGKIVPPEVGHIRRAMEELKEVKYNSRKYILSKWTANHYAVALEKGLLSII